MESLFEQLGGTYTRQGDYCLPDVCLPPEEEHPIGVYGQRRRTFLREHHRVLYYNLLTAGTLDSHLADIEEQAQELFLRLVEQCADTEGVTEALKADGVGAEDERHPKPSERDRDAGNRIWVTSKRGSMTSACFIYSSDRTKKNNVRNNIKNFRNNVIVLSELCQTKFDIVPNFIRARGQKLSGTRASLLIDSCARTSAS